MKEKYQIVFFADIHGHSQKKNAFMCKCHFFIEKMEIQEILGIEMNWLSLCLWEIIVKSFLLRIAISVNINRKKDQLEYLYHFNVDCTL